MNKQNNPEANRSAQKEVHGEALNDFVRSLSAGGKLKQHAEHDTVRRPERQINKFTRFPEKNRFSNAVLFSQGSVDLVQEERSECTYIHASKLPVPGGAVIMGQAPMKDTLIDFYRLIWQEKVSTIVCVVNLEDKEQCYPYFERKAGKKTSCRRFKVRTIAVRTEGKNIINYELKIENDNEKKENRSRVLNIISILGWEPEKYYDVKTILAAIHNAEALKKISSQNDCGKESPMLIHGCSGIRRTGVFALAYIFSKQVLIAREINLLGVIEAVRAVRYGVLRKKKFFYYLLEIIVALVAETGVVKPGSEDHMAVLTVLKKLGGGGTKRKKGGSIGGGSKSDKSDKSEGNQDDDEDGDDGGETEGTTGGAGKATTPKGKSSKKRK